MMWRKSLRRPGDAGLPAASHFSRDWPPFQARVVKPENLDLHPAALERAGENVGAGRRHGDRPAAHRSGVVQQQRHHRVAKPHVLLDLEGQRVERIGEDPRQPRRVQQPFLEIELPGAVLLGHEPALQPVGEPGHHALQAGQLLVEIVAQPRQLIAVAQLLRRDRFVELVGMDPIKIVIARAGKRQLRPPRLIGVRRLLAVGVVGGSSPVALGLVLLRPPRISLGPCSMSSLWALSGSSSVSLAVLGALALIASASSSSSLFFALVGVLAELIGHIERGDHIPRHAGKRRLVVQGVDQMVELACGFLLDPGTPQLHQLAGMPRRLAAGEALAHHQRQRLLERRVLALGGVGDGPLLIAIVEHGAEIVRHPGHDAGADGLDAGLLDRFEDRPGIAAFGLILGMDVDIVIGEPQGEGIGKAAGDRDLARPADRG